MNWHARGGVLLVAAFHVSCGNDEARLVQAAKDSEAECCACPIGDVDCCDRAATKLDARACALGFDSPQCPRRSGKPRDPSAKAQDTIRSSRQHAHDCSVRGAHGTCGGIKNVACPPGSRCVVDLDPGYDPQGVCVGPPGGP